MTGRLPRAGSALLVAAAALMGACAHAPVKEEFPRTHRRYDARVDWKEERRGEILRVSGVLRNDRMYHIGDIELTLCLFGPDRKCVTDKRVFVPAILGIDEEARFSADLAIPPKMVPSGIRFSYSYRLQERGMGSPPYFSTFEEPLDLPPDGAAK